MTETDKQRVFDILGAVKDDIRDLRADHKIAKNDHRTLSKQVTDLETGEDMQTGQILTELKGLKSEIAAVKDKPAASGLKLTDWKVILAALAVIFGGSTGANTLTSQLFPDKAATVKPASPKIEYIYVQPGSSHLHSDEDKRAPKLVGP